MNYSWLIVSMCLVLFTGVFAGCDSSDDDKLTATAEMRDTNGNVIGEVTFTQADATLEIMADVTVAGAASSEHGIHIHAVGSCSPDFTAAGGHYNPFDDALGQYAGDLGLQNLVLDADGRGIYEVTSTRLTLEEGMDGTLFDADGSSVMLHAEPNDETGAAGARIACGIVVAD